MKLIKFLNKLSKCEPIQEVVQVKNYIYVTQDQIHVSMYQNRFSMEPVTALLDTAVKETTARQLAKCECEMILASISIQLLAIPASSMFGRITIIYCSPVDVTK